MPHHIPFGLQGACRPSTMHGGLAYPVFIECLQSYALAAFCLHNVMHENGAAQPFEIGVLFNHLKIRGLPCNADKITFSRKSNFQHINLLNSSNTCQSSNNYASSVEYDFKIMYAVLPIS